GAIREYMIGPQDFGMHEAASSAIRVSDVSESKAMVLSALDDHPVAARDIVALNAGASIYIAGLADSLHNGIQRALSTLKSGNARRKLDEFVACTRRFGPS
ncbi:MAG TPA: anthranilate phosphoribosyltransferase, partial [Burkholderiales bacterium]|nr:anthranilate phosphoribosyltransferase [Burkholderiales bacterium]